MRKSQITVTRPEGEIELEFFLEGAWKGDKPTYELICSVRSEAVKINGISYFFSTACASKEWEEGKVTWWPRSGVSMWRSGDFTAKPTSNASSKAYDMIAKLIADTLSANPELRYGAEIESRNTQVGQWKHEIETKLAEIERMQAGIKKFEQEIADNETLYEAVLVGKGINI